MQLARPLLIDTRLAIIEIAERSRYRSEAVFGRVFKRYSGTLPANYRRSATTRPAV
ncbi:MAG: helix-turn-helix domain-containing protein [Pseudomonadota bacterium]|nr:helix-turn-helix domain-containing protein [Pseudomonadota bacterium]